MQREPSSPDLAYEVRFSLTRQDMLLLPVMLGAVAGGVFAVSEGFRLLGALVVIFPALYLTLRFAQLASRRVALRVDARGVTLALSPPWSARNTAFVPWSDVNQVVLWRQQAGTSSVRYIGVERPEDAPPLPGSARNPLLRRLIPAFLPAHVPVQVAYDSRQINGWRLDHERLAAAVACFAPHVKVVDLG